MAQSDGIQAVFVMDSGKPKFPIAEHSISSNNEKDLIFSTKSKTASLFFDTLI